MVAATMRKIQAPNHDAAVLLVSGSPELNLPLWSDEIGGGEVSSPLYHQPSAPESLNQSKKTMRNTLKATTLESKLPSPHIYMMTNTMKSAIRPPAKMNRYCAFNPLYSTVTWLHHIERCRHYSRFRGIAAGAVHRHLAGV